VHFVILHFFKENYEPHYSCFKCLTVRFHGGFLKKLMKVFHSFTAFILYSEADQDFP